MGSLKQITEAAIEDELEEEFDLRERIDSLIQAAEKKRVSDEKAMDGVKHDTGKPLAAILGDFPHALEAIVAVGTYGANKYTRRGWETVPDGPQRYADALWRHLLKSCYEDNDPESGLPHKWHAAWNLLAIIELEARQAHGV